MIFFPLSSNVTVYPQTHILVPGKRCTMSDLQCGYGNIWITVGTGTNYPDFNFIGSVLQVIICGHGCSTVHRDSFMFN